MSYFLSGILLGLVAGISPGPLLALVISNTLQFGRNEGIKTALVPLLTDLPVILISFFLLSWATKSSVFLSIVSFSGAVFLLFLSYESITCNGYSLSKNVQSMSMKKAILTNLLSPHPFFFWLSVGVPLMLKAYGESLFYPVIFIVSFYFSLIGSKIIVAVLVSKTRPLLTSNMYVFIIKGLGIILIVFAVLFIRDGLKLIGILN